MTSARKYPVAPVRRFHSLAMTAADKGFAANKQGDTENALGHFAEAYYHEWEAAQYPSAPLSKAVLLRSAGWLALHAGLLDEAQAACDALAAVGVLPGDWTRLAAAVATARETATVAGAGGMW